MVGYIICPDCGGEGGWPRQVGVTNAGEPILEKERCERCEGRGEIEHTELGPRHYLMRRNSDYIVNELQNIVWLIDEGPAHIKLTEAIDRIHALKRYLSGGQ